MGIKDADTGRLAHFSSFSAAEMQHSRHSMFFSLSHVIYIQQITSGLVHVVTQ